MFISYHNRASFTSPVRRKHAGAAPLEGSNLTDGRLTEKDLDNELALYEAAGGFDSDDDESGMPFDSNTSLPEEGTREAEDGGPKDEEE